MADNEDNNPNPEEEEAPESQGTPETPAEEPKPPVEGGGRIDQINVADEIKNSFLDYSMSVIVARALPDARDGLKPSQRRILNAMNDLSLSPGRQHRKCAKICGDTSGNYHPHGEAVIYPTLVHMAQPWAMRERLVDGQGNFGSVEGDPPAAMRYTEARMTHLGASLMDDMEKDTVDYVANYDETRTEPVVFPAAFPNLLVNGGTGIAVGMATNIPPHNLVEVINGTCAQIDNPDITEEELMEYIKGPDFPTGCTIYGFDPIKEYFRTGRGSLKVRSKIEIEENENGREIIVVREIPYGVNRAVLVQRIAQLVNEKIITDITAIRDESDENTRIVIEIKRDSIPRVVINNLFKQTQLETSFSVNMLALDHNRPKILGVKELINLYIEHRREVVLRRTKFELAKAERRAEQLEGYLIALANLDEFIRIIRSSKSRDEARDRLLGYKWSRSEVEGFGVLIRSEARLDENGEYKFSLQQITSILDLRLYQLTGLEQDKVKAEYTQLLEVIKDLMDIIAKESRVLAIIKDELNIIKDKHGNPRKTMILPDEGEIAIEDLIANEGMIITITHQGLIKRTSVSSYRAQKRGGKGVIGMSTKKRNFAAEDKEKDFLEHLFTAGAHDYLMFFTNTGRVYVNRVHEIPALERNAKGRGIANLLNLQEGEKVQALKRVISTQDDNGNDVTWQQDGYLFFATRNGTVKKTALSLFKNYRRDGIIAIKLAEDDALIDVALTTGENEVVLITRNGKSIRFKEADARPLSRATAGVRGINLSDDDVVVALAVVESDAGLLVAGEQGIGKRTPFDEYRIQTRGGKGIITMKTNDKTGKIVGSLTVHPHDELMLITASGVMVRTKVDEIREAGRNTSGVKLIDLGKKDSLLALAPVVHDEDDDGEEDEEGEEGDVAEGTESDAPAEDAAGEEEQGGEE